MKNVLWGNGFALLSNFQGLCSSRWEGEHCSLPGNLCTVALPITAQESQEEGLEGFSPPAHAGVPLCWQQVGILDVRALFPSPVAAEALSTAGFWGSCSSPGAALVLLPLWKVMSGRCSAAEAQWAQGSVSGARDPETFTGNWKPVRNSSSI